MEINQLRYFRTVAEEEHISRAAEKLNISQPALSTTIRRLENDLGVELFDHVGRTIKLNENGKILLERANRILMLIDDTENILQELARQEKKMISLAVTSPQFIEGVDMFIKEHPDFKWKLQVMKSAEIVKALKVGRSDLAVTSPAIMGDGIEHESLLEDEMKIAVHPNNPLAKLDKVNLRDIANENFIMLEKGLPFREQTDKMFHEQNVQPNIAWECDHSLRRALINANLGITVSSSSAQFRHLYDENIKFLKIADAHATREISIAWSRDHFLTKPVRAFRQFMIDRYHKFAEEKE